MIKKIPFRRPLLVLCIAAAIGGGLYFLIAGAGKGGFGKGFDKNKVQPVSAAPVKVMDMPVWLNAIGTLSPRNLVTVRSRVEGELQKLNVNEGQLVKLGQVLAEIDPRALQVQLIQAQGQLARDSAMLKNAQLDLERYRTLLEKDSISRQQVDTQDALVRQHQGTVAMDQGVVANAQLQLSYTRITAPVAGRVGLRQVDPGNIVKPADTNGIITIAQVQPIIAVFAVPENNLPIVTQALANKEAAVVELWDRELGKRLATGKLLTADNQIDTTTGTLKLKAEFSNADNTLFPNQFVNVRLAAGEAKQAKVVPSAAVLRGAKGNYVYVVNEDKVSAVPVKLGPVNGDQQVIEGDVAAGANVVSDGADKLRDGAKVEVISAEARDKATRDEGKRGDKKRGDGSKGEGSKGERAKDGGGKGDSADKSSRGDNKGERKQQ